MTARKASGGVSKKAKPAKQKHYTPAQNRAMRAYFRHHPTPKKKPKRVAKRGAPGPAVEPGYWIAGDNDTMPSCVPVAIANAILAQTGRRASVSDLEALSVALGDAEGMFIPDALEALCSD